MGLQRQGDTNLEWSIVIFATDKRNLLKRKANIKEVEPGIGNRERKKEKA